MIELIDKDGAILAKGTIVKDGQKLKVPLAMMTDAAPAAIEAITRAALGDAQRSQAVRHSPGYGSLLTDADRDAREKARDERKVKLADAWKTPPAVDAAVADVTQVNSAWQRKQARLAQAWKMGPQASWKKSGAN
jgi:hypothetical protein